MLRAWNNPARFLSSISPAHWGNPQPTRTFKRRLVASIFTSTNKAKCRVIRHRPPADRKE